MAPLPPPDDFSTLPQLAQVQASLPPGFHIQPYSLQVPGARQLALGPKGTVLVGTAGDKVYALVDKNQDHVVDTVYRIFYNPPQ